MSITSLAPEFKYILIRHDSDSVVIGLTDFFRPEYHFEDIADAEKFPVHSHELMA